MNPFAPICTSLRPNAPSCTIGRVYTLGYTSGYTPGAGIAAAQSYDKYKDLRRAGIQAAGSAVLGLISLGASNYLSGALAAGRAGAAAVDLNGAPVEFLGGMGIGATIDGICDITKGSAC